MLALTRKVLDGYGTENQVVITLGGQTVRLWLVPRRGVNSVRVVIDAPREVAVDRGEVDRQKNPGPGWGSPARAD